MGNPRIRGAGARNVGPDDRRSRLLDHPAKQLALHAAQRGRPHADFFNFSNTRNFAIPEARVNNTGFANQWGTDGGNRRIFLSAKYLF
jgi:hypothetical protein